MIGLLDICIKQENEIWWKSLHSSETLLTTTESEHSVCCIQKYK